jgi:4,5-DOPA dioxygenase extradiol
MSSTNPKTVHDFSGFPEALYEIEYLAEGSVQGAARVAEALSNAGIEWEFDARRGFDFGCWSPLALLFPDADIPVLQVSLHGSLEPEHHIALGEALSPLRHEGFLIVCTGGVTHNPMEISLSDQPPPLWAETVDTFVANVLLSPAGDGDDMTARRKRSQRLAACDGSERVAAAMAAAHPAGTYLLPLLVAAAAGGTCAPLHRGWIHGCLSAAAYVFGTEVPAAAARRHLANMAR